MTTIIQHSTTGQYLNTKGEWVAEPSEALAFESSVAALGYLIKNHTRNALLVLRFPDSQYDVYLQGLNQEVLEPHARSTRRTGGAVAQNRRKPGRRSRQASPPAQAQPGKDSAIAKH